jgi:cell division protein FtsB
MKTIFVIFCLCVLAFGLYLLVKWIAEMIAYAEQTEREEKLERRNAKLRRDRAVLEHENAALKYQLSHPQIHVKIMYDERGV